MFAPRTPSAEGMLLLFPDGAVPRSKTVLKGLLLTAQVLAGAPGGTVQGLAYALVASCTWVHPSTTCPGMVGSCSSDVENSELVESPPHEGAMLNQLLPPSLVRLVWPYVYSSMMLLLLFGSIVVKNPSPPKISYWCPSGVVLSWPWS